MLRRQLPVHSPVTWGALFAGFWAMARGDKEGHLRARLAEAIAAHYGARDVLLTDSGTSALRLAIAEGVRGEARMVALPGYGCYDLATAAEGAGAIVILYDLDPRTLGPDADSFALACSRGPAVIVIAHLFGYPVDMTAVRAQAGSALVIEDAAQGAGGRLSGRPLGGLGSLSVLSFGRGKGVTGGGGGAVLANDDRGQQLLDRMRERIGALRAARGARQLTALAAQRMLGRPSVYGLPSALPFLHLGETVYRPPHDPRLPTTASLAVLEHALSQADREVSVRVEHARRLLPSLASSPHVQAIAPISGAEPGYLRLPAMLRRGRPRSLATTLAHRAKSLGITPMYPTTLEALPSLRPRLASPSLALPGSRRLTEGLVTLPTHGLLAEADLTALERWLVEG